MTLPKLTKNTAQTLAIGGFLVSGLGMGMLAIGLFSIGLVGAGIAACVGSMAFLYGATTVGAKHA